jgi:hypothetical protein
VPLRSANIVAVEHSPGGAHAVVFIAHNEPPDVEPYVVLCEKTPEAGSRARAVPAEVSWMSTSEDDSIGVQTTWDPRTVRWNVSARKEPERSTLGTSRS